MNREKLKEEAEEYAHNNYKILIDTGDAFVTSKDYLRQGYLAGAEPREKIIAKLEKLNKNQEENLRITLLEEDRKAKRIKELEEQIKTGGFLPEEIERIDHNYEEKVSLCYSRIDDLEYKLIKAKETIKNLLTYCRNYPQQALEKIQQAEQFLREEEEIKENTKAPTLEEIKNRLSNIGEAIGDIALDYIIRLEKENTELSEKLNEQKQYTQFKCSEAVDTIEKLKTFIRKMKRCQNCDKFDYTENKCKVGWCNNFEKWALKEVEFVDPFEGVDDDSK